MKPKKTVILFLIILFTILQCTLLERIQIFKTKPDILLVLIIFFSLNFGQIYGFTVGALCGAFSEATCGVVSGLLVLTYSLGGVILGHISRWIDVRKIFDQICVSFIFSLSIYLFLYFLLQIQSMNLPLLGSSLSVILPASFYTACVSPLLFYFLKTVFIR